VPRHLIGKLRPYLIGGSSGDGGSSAAAGVSSVEAEGATAVFEDVGDGSLWVESSGGWSDDDEGLGELEVGALAGVELYGSGGGLLLGLRGAEGEGVEDEELAAARRHYLEVEAAKKAAKGQRAKRGGGGRKGGVDASRRLMEHQLPWEWEAVVLGGAQMAGEGAGSSKVAAAAGVQL